MKLPNAERAVVDIMKLTEYCLSKTHPRGRHKAFMFERILGLRIEHAEELRSALLSAARTQNATPAYTDEFGQRYVMDFTIRHGSHAAIVRSAWIVRTEEDFPRFVSCYVAEGRKP